MSDWSSINCIIHFIMSSNWRNDLAEPIMQYIVDKAVFKGSEGNAEVKIINKLFGSYYYVHEIMSNKCDEYDANANIQLELVDGFTVSINGNLRDKVEDETIKEFENWIKFINNAFPEFFTIDIEYLNIDFDEENGKHGLLVINNRKVTEYKSE